MNVYRGYELVEKNAETTYICMVEDGYVVAVSDSEAGAKGVIDDWHAEWREAVKAKGKDWESALEAITSCGETV